MEDCCDLKLTTLDSFGACLDNTLIDSIILDGTSIDTTFLDGVLINIDDNITVHCWCSTILSTSFLFSSRLLDNTELFDGGNNGGADDCANDAALS